MTALSLDLFRLFAEPPGDFLYFLIVIISSQIGLFMLLSVNASADSTSSTTIRRYRMALFGIITAWLLLLAFGLLSIGVAQVADHILPTLERTITALSITIIGWVFITADAPTASTRWPLPANAILTMLTLLILAGFAATALLLNDNISFNQSPYGIGWAFGAAALVMLGLLLVMLLLRALLDAPLKLTYFVILFLGHAATLYQAVQGNLIGDYAGAARLSFAAGSIVLTLIIFRVTLVHLRQQRPTTQSVAQAAYQAVATPAQASPASAASARTPQAFSEAAAYPQRPGPTEAQLLKSLGLILDASTPAEIPQHIVYATMDLLQADVGALLRLQDFNYADVTVAYDKILSQKPPPTALNLHDQPTLANSIERQTQRALYPDRNTDELQDLYTRLNIEHIGPAYFQPLTRNGELVAVMMICLPYTKRELERGEIELLTGVGIISGSLLALAYSAEEASTIAEDRFLQTLIEQGAISDSDTRNDESRQALEAELRTAHDQVVQLSNQVEQLQGKLNSEHNRLTQLLGDTQEGLSISQSIMAVTDEQQHLRSERNQLQQRLQQAEATLSSATTTSNDGILHNLVQSLRSERDKLLGERTRLQQQLDEIRAQDRTVLPSDMQALLNRMIEEKTRLEVERNQLNDRLTKLMDHLSGLGIENGATGLAQLIGRLYEEKAQLQMQVERLQQEQAGMLNERMKLADAIAHENERSERIEMLQAALQNVSADREAAIKQRDNLRQQHNKLQETLDQVKEHRARLLAKVSGYEIELHEAHEAQSTLRAQLQQLANDNSQLNQERDNLLGTTNALQATYSSANGDANGSDQHINELRNMVQRLTQERNQLQRDLHQVQHALADTENQLERVQFSLDEQTETSAGLPEERYRPSRPDLLVGLVQELRTPMTSISGYVDLMLKETPGILGEMQRKFLQRVASNIHRLEGMINDLVQVAALDAGQHELEPRPIDVVTIIEEAITQASMQFREKGLAVQLDLEDDLPPLPADRDSVQQIINQLLLNAYLASPQDTQVSVRASKRRFTLNGNRQAVDCVWVAVSDRGGGIQQADIPRVFARKYRADHTLIAGLGDTGVGLSIAQALTRTHNGQLWAESEPGVGSTFNIALPLQTETADVAMPNASP